MITRQLASSLAGIILSTMLGLEMWSWKKRWRLRRRLSRWAIRSERNIN